MEEARQRDLFSLPALETLNQQFCERPASRSVVRRRLRAAHADKWAAEGIDVLNDLYGSIGSRSDVSPNA
eukprot:7127331-Pyramimonas_sp.AAC.1